MKKTNGITLIALIITIIVMLILVAVTVSVVINSNLIGIAQDVADATKQAYENEGNFGNGGITIGGVTYPSLEAYTTGWDATSGVNYPKLATGMKAVYWDNAGNEIVQGEDEEFNWNNWFDYKAQAAGVDGTSRWANAKTEDGSYWVWIPRFSYKIESGCYTNETGTISVKFLQGTTNKDSDGNEISTTYPTVTNGAMAEYVVHPAFRNGSNTNYMNGEWDKEITGFWVAKYQAGYQANTITDNNGILSTELCNNENQIRYSNKKYTTLEGIWQTNAIGQDLTKHEDVNDNEFMSYPVFKPLTYAYNIMTVGDSFTLSQEIAKASEMYGLKATETDSHLMKNSEWGAIAYLTHSQYGRNGNELNINNYYTSTESPYRLAITGVYATNSQAEATNELSNVNAYYTADGQKGSSTGNITGVYDFSGCLYERSTAYVPGGKSVLRYAYSYANLTKNKDGYKEKGWSTKYATAYPYNDSFMATASLTENSENNYNAYKGLKTSMYGYGDAILETSSAGIESNSWNGDLSFFFQGLEVGGEVTCYRGGLYNGGSSTGVFAFTRSSGSASINGGFRAILISE